MPKRKTAKFTKTKRPIRPHKSDGWFFERRAPDLPFWIFLVLGILVLVMFGLWLKNPKEATVENLIVPTLPKSSTTVTPTVSPTSPTLIKTATITDAADPSIVTNQGKIYVTFRNNTGGYSVAVYDENLTLLEAPRWITNGSVIPNQLVATPIFYGGDTWYLGYVGGDGYVRLANYDTDFNPRRTIIFRTRVSTLSSLMMSVCTGSKSLALIVADSPTSSRTYKASYDMGILGDFAEKPSEEGGVTCRSQATALTLGTKTYQAETVDTTVLLKLLQQ